MPARDIGLFVTQPGVDATSDTDQTTVNDRQGAGPQPDETPVGGGPGGGLLGTVNANSLFGNNTGVVAPGMSLTVAQVKTLLAYVIGDIGGLGTGVATALAVNIGSAGAPVLFNGALGTPTSGTVTNLTGTASININGTVGATTPGTIACTTFTASGIAQHTDATDSTGTGTGGGQFTGGVAIAKKLYGATQTVLGNTSTDYTGQGILFLRGTARGIRMYTSAANNIIEGVDQTGTGSFQPMFLGGSSVGILISGSTTATFAAASTLIAGTMACAGAAISTSAGFVFPVGTTSVASLRIPHGAAPSAPVNGDMWTTSAGGLFVRINGVTVGPLT